jgi:hypothetical protein
MTHAGWNATRVAFTAGVSEYAVRKWLSGATIPGGDKLEMLRAALPGLAERLDADRPQVQTTAS